jgi:hypothetical protein
MPQPYQTPEGREAILLLASQRPLRVRKSPRRPEREWWLPRSPAALLKAATARAQALGWADPISWLEGQLGDVDFELVQHG